MSKCCESQAGNFCSVCGKSLRSEARVSLLRHIKSNIQTFERHLEAYSRFAQGETDPRYHRRVVMQTAVVAKWKSWEAFLEGLNKEDKKA